MQTLSDSTPKARKAHMCEMCHRTIDIGETYTRQANLGDEGFYSWINCQAIATCYALEDMRDRASIERDALRARNERQHATLTKIRALLGDHDGPLWAVRGVREADIRKALTEPTPKGKP